MQDADLTQAQVQSLSSTTELMDRQWAPCRYNCPVHADVRLYLEHIAGGRWKDAIDVIREALPLAAVCGRICHHPCEANCRRNDVDKPVAIREVKRFVAELQGAAGCTVAKTVQNKAAIAIVGAGPAGLAAALELAKMGYRPTLLEKFPRAGGIPATAIPAYRMPRDVLQIDVDWIVSHGVTLKTGVEVGKDVTLGQLAKDYAAVVVAAGLSRSRGLPLGGGESASVFPVLEFLQEIAFDRRPAIGQDVLVIGGGNVAVDAARSALRLGAKRVRMMCLENEQEMPAWSWEQDEAREEGIEIIYRRGPVSIASAGGKMTGLMARKVKAVFDASKRFNPQYDDSDVIQIDCDTVVLAIGQMADTGFIKDSALKLDDRGRLVFNRDTQQTSEPNIFACGEIVTPPGSAVEACASGKRAAVAIDLFLTGKPIKIDDALPPYIGKIDAQTAQKLFSVPRQVVAAEEPQTRRQSFAPFDRNYTAGAAVAEASRCMSCGAGAEVIVDKCAACLTCLRACPFGIPKVTDVARIDSALCQACGICIAECPANAIVARGWESKDISRRIAAAVKSLPAGRKALAFICGYRTPPALRQANDGVAGVAEITLPSLARLGTRDLLAAFEGGADAVMVIASNPTAERYPQATARMKMRVEQARGLLSEAGLSADRLAWREIACEDRAAVVAALSELAK